MKYFMKVFLFFILLSFSKLSPADPPYKGKGGLIEAYGKIMGTYFTAISISEACGESLKYKDEAEKTIKNYLHTNQNVLNKSKSLLFKLALDNGGEDEKIRLEKEINSTINKLYPELKKSMKKDATSLSCATILGNMRKGMMDLEVVSLNEIHILDNNK